MRRVVLEFGSVVKFMPALWNHQRLSVGIILPVFLLLQEQLHACGSCLVVWEFLISNHWHLRIRISVLTYSGTSHHYPVNHVHILKLIVSFVFRNHGRLLKV